MKAYRISTEEFKFKEIYEFSVTKKINEHQMAKVVGLSDLGDDELVRLLQTKKEETVVAIDENGETTLLFSGIIFDSSIKVTGDLRVVTLTLIGATYLADLHLKSRSYQNSGTQFSEIINNAATSNQQFANTRLCNSSINNIIVQYQETDWEFVMRVASYLGLCVIPNCVKSNVEWQIGLTDQSPREMAVTAEYEVSQITDKNVDNAIVYKVESREVYEIGERVNFLGKDLYVYAVDGYYKGEEYVAKYELRFKNGFTIRKYRNMKFVGAALDATVAEVKADSVSVKLGVDTPYGAKAEHFFPYASVYSSPDGTGWYCMPESGDAVRLFFPSEKEEDAYVINAVHVSEGSEASQNRSNPDNKVLMNPQKKMVMLTPTEIVITNSNGLTITLNDESGITISSDLDINLDAKGMISLVSSTGGIETISSTQIELKQGASSITLNDDLTIDASQVYIQQ